MEAVLDRLWIGSAPDFLAPLPILGFAGVLDLRDGVGRAVDSGKFQTDIDYFQIDNRDGDPWSLDQVLEGLGFITEKIRYGKVLVACAAGMSRSASMVIGYLVRVGFDEASAFEMVKRARPKIAPVPKMLQSILEAVRS